MLNSSTLNTKMNKNNYGFTQEEIDDELIAMKNRGVKYPKRRDAADILKTKAKRQQQQKEIVDLTDDAIYDSYLKMDEDELITSQEPEKFIYATAGQIEPIEYSICRGSAEEVMQMLKQESVVVWRNPEASAYELFKNRGDYTIYPEGLQARINNYAFYVARRDEIA